MGRKFWLPCLVRKSAVALALVAAVLVAQACDAYREVEISGNEAAAIKSLQNIAVYQRLYNKRHGGDAYGTFDQLRSEVNMHERFAGAAPVVDGYVFTMKVRPKAGGQPAFFSVNADPHEGTSATGRKHFYIDAGSDTVKVNERQPAGPGDPPADQ